MIKRTMYFKDEKQANLIKKVNDKIHRRRGVNISDAEVDAKLKSSLTNALKDLIKEYKNNLSTAQGMLSKVLSAKDTKSLMIFIGRSFHDLPRNDMEEIRQAYYEAEDRLKNRENEAERYSRMFPD